MRVAVGAAQGFSQYQNATFFLRPSIRRQNACEIVLIMHESPVVPCVGCILTPQATFWRSIAEIYALTWKKHPAAHHLGPGIRLEAGYTALHIGGKHFIIIIKEANQVSGNMQQTLVARVAGAGPFAVLIDANSMIRKLVSTIAAVIHQDEFPVLMRLSPVWFVERAEHYGGVGRLA